MGSLNVAMKDRRWTPTTPTAEPAPGHETSPECSKCGRWEGNGTSGSAFPRFSPYALEAV